MGVPLSSWPMSAVSHGGQGEPSRRIAAHAAGKGGAIGAGAGAVTQILTKGRAIKVPAESVLTFNLDKTVRLSSAYAHQTYRREL